MRTLFRSSRSWLGIDIGAASLKVAHVAPGRAGPVLLAAGIAPTPPGSVASGAAADPGPIGQALGALLREARIPARPAALALGGEAALVRELSLPSMPDPELDRAVAYEVERYIAGGLTQAVHDYQVMGRDDGHLDVLLVAARREVADRHVSCLRPAGLTPWALEAAPLSLLRALAAQGGGDEATAYIDLGASGTHLLIAEGTRVRLARHIGIGGDALTRAVASALGLDPADAQALKERAGQAPLPGASPESAEAEAAAAAMAPILTQLVTEIRRGLDFYHSRSQGRAVGRALVAGGTSRLRHLVPFLSAELGIPAQAASPLASLETAQSVDPGLLRETAPLLGVAVGLALRGVDGL
jgi:type IV pilus assembly protein PilM